MSENLFVKKCAYCGKMFNTAHYPTLCCSQNCYFKYKLRKENQEKLRKLKALSPHLKAHICKDEIFYVKTCPVCGKVFDTSQPLQLYCSDSCKRRSKVLKERFDYYDSPFPVNNGDTLPERKYLRISDVCRYLSVSRRTVARLVENGLLPKYKLGQIVFFKLEDIDKVFSVRNDMSTVDLLRYSKKYLSISEISKKYDMKPSHVRYILKENNLHQIVSGRTFLYETTEVESLFSYLKPGEQQASNGNYSWASADELANRYDCKRNFVYHFTKAHNVPFTRNGRNVLYSSEHFDKAFKNYERQQKQEEQK